MKPSDLLTKTLAETPLRKLVPPDGLTKEHRERLGAIDAKLRDIRQRIEALEARDRLARVPALSLPRA
jgi:hypothetical protein